MASTASRSTVFDILRSPEYTGEEVFDQKAFRISSIIKSGKHGQVALCDSGELEGPLSAVAVKTELIKSPQNPQSRPYREYFILKQLGTLCLRPDYYANPQWVGFVRLLDWFKAKTDVIRIKDVEDSDVPDKTPTKLAFALQAPHSTARPTRATNSTSNAPMSAPKSLMSRSRLTADAENVDISNLAESLGQLAPFSPLKRRNVATPAPKRAVPRTPMMLSSSKKQREIKLQEGNLVLERADTTLYHLRQSVSFPVYRDLLFQIMYALYVAQSEFEFVHHDLHLQNVLLKRLKVEEEASLEETLGVFALGETTWYSRGPWVVKMSDFGLSRINMGKGGSVVVYDAAQPLSEAFVGDRDVLKVLDEFSRVKITHWLDRSDLEACGVKMSNIKSTWFSEVDDTILLDDVLSTLQEGAAIDRLNGLIAERQKAVKTIRTFIRKSALHLRAILCHEFFEPLHQMPTSLWLLEGSAAANAKLGFGSNSNSPSTLALPEPTSPTLLRPNIHGTTSSTTHSPAPGTPAARRGMLKSALPTPISLCEESVPATINTFPVASSTLDSPPLAVKKLDFTEELSSSPTASPTLHRRTQAEVDTTARTSSPAFTPVHACAPLESVDVDDLNHVPLKAAKTERRSTRVASKIDKVATPSPRRVKPDPSVLVHHSDLESQEEQEQQQNMKRAPTPIPSGSKTRKARRATILPDAFDSTVRNTPLGGLDDHLASLSIDAYLERQPSAPVQRQVKVEYEPVPRKWLGEPMVLPMLDKTPLNCIEALKEYLSRRASQLQESGTRRKKDLKCFFVRTADEEAVARVERLARRRRRRKPVGRRSLGSLSSVNEAKRKKVAQQAPIESPEIAQPQTTSPAMPKGSNKDNQLLSNPFEPASTTSAEAEPENKEKEKAARLRRRSLSSPRELSRAVVGEPHVQAQTSSQGKPTESMVSHDCAADDEGDYKTRRGRPSAAAVSPAVVPPLRATTKPSTRARLAAATSSSPVPEDFAVLSASSDGQRITTPTAPRRISRRSSLTPTPFSPLFPSITTPAADDFTAAPSKPAPISSRAAAAKRPPTPVKSATPRLRSSSVSKSASSAASPSSTMSSTAAPKIASQRPKPVDNKRTASR